MFPPADALEDRKSSSSNCLKQSRKRQCLIATTQTKLFTNAKECDPLKQIDRSSQPAAFDGAFLQTFSLDN